MSMDRLPEAERYLKEAVEQGGSEVSTNYHVNVMQDEFLSGKPDWKNNCSGPRAVPMASFWKAQPQPSYLFLGRMHEADLRWASAAQRAEQQHFSDSAGGLYAVKALHDALVSNCSAARDAAHKGLALDHSNATVPDAALALALCGEHWSGAERGRTVGS